MVQADGKNSPERIATAAGMLIGGDLGEDRASRTVFVSNRVGDPVLERCVVDAARNADVGIVALRWGRDATSAPRRANIAFTEDGAPVEVRDCVLWAGDDEGRIVLVPWDAREDYHFAVGSDGLERRAGRPATMLGEGMSRAKARLLRTARELRREQLHQMLTIVTDARAA